ncbi:hypothetical protein ACIGW1_09800 [Streptomyces sp. NPDC053780]|uniref:hypothetical protein n=1 Tax=unclassified Streptomyces TaxID=2593676 RepID=UPI003449C36E
MRPHSATPPPADLQHPNAERILAEKGISLHRGDGHIFFADCGGSPEQIQVWTRKSGEGKYCFQLDLAKNDIKGVGEGVEGAPTVLLGLRVTG